MLTVSTIKFGFMAWQANRRHVATPGLAERAESSVVEREPSYVERWSDDAPVTVRYHT